MPDSQYLQDSHAAQDTLQGIETNDLDDAYEALHEARLAMKEATKELSATQGVTIGQRTYGRFYQTDPEIQILIQAVTEAEARYAYIWHVQIPQAKAQLEQRQQQALLREKDAWAEAVHPTMVNEIRQLRETIRVGVPDSREVYVAKYQLQQTVFKLQQLWNQSQES